MRFGVIRQTGKAAFRGFFYFAPHAPLFGGYIDRFISGESAAAILADIGIPKSTFYNWVRIYQEEQAELNRKTVDNGRYT